MYNFLVVGGIFCFYYHLCCRAFIQLPHSVGTFSFNFLHIKTTFISCYFLHIPCFHRFPQEIYLMSDLQITPSFSPSRLGCQQTSLGPPPVVSSFPHSHNSLFRLSNFSTSKVQTESLKVHCPLS